MSQEELREKLEINSRKMESWDTAHQDFDRYTRGLLCFPGFRPSIKPEYHGLMWVSHYGKTCQDDKFICILEFTDGRLQEMPPHPPGECPWCEYKYFDLNK